MVHLLLPSDRRSAARRSSRPGFLLVEILLGLALFATFFTAASYGLFKGSQDTANAGNTIRAMYLAQGALSAAQSVDFTSLTTGTFTVNAGTGGGWDLVPVATPPPAPTSADPFSTTVVIAPNSPSPCLSLTATTQWNYAETPRSISVRSDRCPWVPVTP